MAQRLIEQRREGDCGLAALANYLHIRYEDLYVEAIKVNPHLRKGDGLLLRDLRDISKRLHRPLRIIRRCDLDSDKGVLGVLWNNPSKQYGTGHWVVLVEGKILDGAELYNADEYLLEKNARPGWLLTEEDV